MIRKIALVALCLAAFSVSAQETTTETVEPLKSKKGELILPQAGEWGLGIDATPFLNYLGNFFHGNSYNNSPSFNSAKGVAITGKYMVDAKTAYRLRFALNRSSENAKNMVSDDSNQDPESKYVEDKISASSVNVVLGAGLEKRRGNGRVQGFYGAEALIGITSFNEKYSYGNNFDTDNNGNSPTTTIWDGVGSIDDVDNYSNRITEKKSGGQFSFGLNGFIGVEYFIAPKIALGGEVGYGINFRSNPKGKEVYEFYDFGNNEKKTETNESFNSTGRFDIGTSTFGSINLMFYF